MSITEFLHNPKIAITTAAGTFVTSIAEWFGMFDSAAFAAVCAGLLSLTMAISHWRKTSLELKLKAVEIEAMIDEQTRKRIEAEQRAQVVGRKLTRESDK